MIKPRPLSCAAARSLARSLHGAASAKEIVVNFPDRGPAYPIGTITLR